MRAPFGWDSTTANGGSTSSGDLTLLSSVAGQRYYIYAYGFSQVSSGLNVLRLMSGSTVSMWRVSLAGPQGGGGASTGGASVNENLFVTPPAYLCRTAIADPLVLSRSSTANTHYSVAAWRGQ